MASFFEKLKKGMNLEMNIDEPEEGKEEKKPMLRKQKSAAEKKQAAPEEGIETPEEKKKEVVFTAKRGRPRKQEIKKEIPVAVFASEEDAPETNEDETENEKEEKSEPAEVFPEAPAETPEPQKPAEKTAIQPKENWPDADGELVVDIFQTETELIVQSAVAGIKPEELNIDIEKDVLIIKGERKNNECEKRDYFFQECYWGPFSRQIILPVEVDSGRVKAEMKEGILTIRMPKIVREGKKKISVQSV